MLLDPNEFRLMEQFGIRHTLVLRRVSEDDFGNYSCSGENHLGKSRAFIEVSGKILLLFLREQVANSLLSSGCNGP